MRHLPALVAALAVLCVSTPAFARQHDTTASHREAKPTTEKAPKTSRQKADWDKQDRNYVIGYDRADGRHVVSYLRTKPKQSKVDATDADTDSSSD